MHGHNLAERIVANPGAARTEHAATLIGQYKALPGRIDVFAKPDYDRVRHSQISSYGFINIYHNQAERVAGPNKPPTHRIYETFLNAIAIAQRLQPHSVLPARKGASDLKT